MSLCAIADVLMAASSRLATDLVGFPGGHTVGQPHSLLAVNSEMLDISSIVCRAYARIPQVSCLAAHPPKMPQALPTRRIGINQVTAIGYGAMGIAAFYGVTEPDEARLKVRDERSRILHWLTRGYTHSSWTISTRVGA